MLGQEEIAAEITLDGDIVPSGDYKNVAAPKTVLLTGGTGFLGAFVIADLLRLTQARIYCLVRADSAAAAMQRLLDNLAYYGLSTETAESRLFAVAGDLEQPELGLDFETHSFLAEHVDTIYHMAASVSFMSGYEKIRDINVNALKHVLRLACLRKTKAVHYVSTYAVFNSDAYTLAETVYETDLAGCGTGFIRGYDQSKWVAEKICQLARDRGIPINIYRAGFISGDSFSGTHNKMDPIALLFAVVLNNRSAFEIDLLLHLTPVDYCSLAMVKLSLNPDAQNKTFHLVQEHPINCMDLLNWLREEDHEIEFVAFADWYDRLKALCRRKPGFFPVLYLFSLKENQSFGDGENISSLRFDSENVKRYLDPIYQCPKLERTILRRYFDYISAPEREYQALPAVPAAVNA